MRVLVTTPTFFPIVGGAELLIRDVLNTWSARHDVRLLTPRLPEKSQPFWVQDGDASLGCSFEVKHFIDRFNLLDLRGHRLTRGLIPPTSLSALPVLSREARAMGADVLVGFFGVPYGLTLAAVSARLGIPYVIVLCGTDLPSPRTTPVPFWGDYLRFVARRASKAVYVSRFCFDVLNTKRFDPVHDRVIFGGVQLREPLRRPDKSAFRASLGIGESDIMLFALQRLGCEKRVDVLIRALAELPRLEQRVRLVIGGQGTEAGLLQALAVQLGVQDDVIFTGHLGAEKNSYYQACDIFVFHSLFETFGQVLAEAMGAGKPIVSVRAGAISEVVDEGVTGLLADPVDVAGLARQIAELVRDEPRRIAMGAAGRRRAEQLFDWSCVRNLWIDVLETDEAADQAFVAQPKQISSEVGS